MKTYTLLNGLLLSVCLMTLSAKSSETIAYFPFDTDFLSVVNVVSNPQSPVLFSQPSGQIYFATETLPGDVIVANGRGRTNGGCLVVDQSRVYLDMSGFDTGETMTSATLEFYFKSASTVDWGCKIGLMKANASSIGDSARPFLFSLQRNSAGQMQARVDAVSHNGTDVQGVNYVYHKGGSFNNEWHHLAMTIAPLYSDQNVHTGSTVTCYIDASRVGVATMGNPWRGFAPDSDGRLYLTIGEWNSVVSVDEVRLSKGCLTQEEFLSVRETPVPLTGDVLAYFPFEQSLASVAPCDARDKPYQRTGVTPIYSTSVGRDKVSTVDLEQVVNGENRHCLDVRSIYQFAMPYWALGAGSLDSATIEFFAKGGSASVNWMTLLKFGHSSQPIQFIVQLNSGSPRLFTFRADGWSSMQDYESVTYTVPAEKGTFADGRWHHFAMTAEPCGGGRSTIKFYFDHELVHQKDTAAHPWHGLDPSTMYFYMGRNECDFLIDEVRITKGALSSDKMLRFGARGLLVIFR